MGGLTPSVGAIAMERRVLAFAHERVELRVDAGEKSVERLLPLGDGPEGGFPGGGQLGTRRDGGQSGDERAARESRDDGLPVPDEKAAFKERLEDGGTRGGRAEAVRFGENLLDARIADELGNAAHRSNERGVGEGLGRGGLARDDGQIADLDRVAGLQAGQRGRILGRVAVAFVGRFVGAFRTERPPTERQDLPPVRDESLSRDVELDPRLEVFVGGIELREIPPADERVDGALTVGERGGGPARVCRRDDRVVGRNLGVVPRLGSERPVGAGGRSGKDRGGLDETRHDLLRLGELPFGQVRAIRARVREKAMGFVEALARVENGLGRETERPAGVHLQGRERIRERGRFALAIVGAVDDASLLAPNARRHGVGDRAIAEAFFVVEVRGGARIGDPGGAKDLAGLCLYRDGDDVIGNRVKGRDGLVAGDDKPKNGRLHAADRKDAVVAGGATEQGVEARHVHAVEPVGALACEGRRGERRVRAIGLERAERMRRTASGLRSRTRTRSTGPR